MHRQPRRKLKQTTRKPANIKPARHARVNTGTASHGLATCLIMCRKQPRVEWTTKPKIPESFEGYTFRASVYTVWVLPTMVHSYSAW